MRVWGGKGLVSFTFLVMVLLCEGKIGSLEQTDRNGLMV